MIWGHLTQIAGKAPLLSQESPSLPTVDSEGGHHSSKPFSVPVPTPSKHLQIMFLNPQPQSQHHVVQPQSEPMQSLPQARDGQLDGWLLFVLVGGKGAKPGLRALGVNPRGFIGLHVTWGRPCPMSGLQSFLPEGKWFSGPFP